MFDNDYWLDQIDEPVIEPELEIVDAHFHFWKEPERSYDISHYVSDLNSGHNIVQAIFMECRTAYRESGPEHLRPIGETEFVAKQAAEPHSEGRIAGIVAHADLTSRELDEVLDAHGDAGGSLLKGIRHSGAYDPKPDQLMIPGHASPDLFQQDQFVQGVERLGSRGLIFDTWIYHHQLKSFRDLAEAVPCTKMVLDHVGMPLGVGVYAKQKAAVFSQWKEDLAELAQSANVFVKLGGLAMPDMGFGWNQRGWPANTNEFVATYSHWYNHVVDCFGADRCMFESNFPVDRLSASYRTVWNGFKQISADYSKEARTNLFCAVARKVYGLPTL